MKIPDLKTINLVLNISDILFPLNHLDKERSGEVDLKGITVFLSFSPSQ